MTQSINNISPLSLLEAQKKDNNKDSNSDFFSVLTSALNDVNNQQVKSDNALKDIATGQVKDLHQAAIAIDKAEISMKVMLEVRNKALSAYKEILRTQL
jgi:flagellar hook-basal body complex protein FliE